MLKDEIFKENVTTVADFNFGEKVASVFDDMLDRSVPFYREIQRMLMEMAADFAVEGTNIYDLGCSTGTTMLNLGLNIPGKIKFIGIDYSQDMLARCKQKLAEHHFSREHELICADLNQGVNIENASVVVMILTLQFISMEFNWKRLIIKEYATPFVWITGLTFLIMKDTYLDYGYDASKYTLWPLSILSMVVTCAFFVAWYFKKNKFLRSN